MTKEKGKETTMYWTLLGSMFGMGTILWWVVLAQYIAN